MLVLMKKILSIAKVQANALVNAVEQGSATKEDIAKLDVKMAKLEGEIKLNRWMIGLVIVIEVLPFLKAFLGS